MSDIETVDFYCPDNGDIKKSRIIKISLPKKCCGVETKVMTTSITGDSISYFYSCCMKHMSTFTDVWNNFVVKKFGLIPNVTNHYALHCKICNVRNDYAEPNQKDGTYICTPCRS